MTDYLPALFVIYIASGIGILGASKKWTHVGWALYSVMFLAHAIALSLAP